MQKIIQEELSSQDKKDTEVSDKFFSLESKPWFRLIKIIYILSCITVFGVGSFLLWEGKPYLTFDNDKSYVKCDRDIGTDWIYPLSKSGWSEFGEYRDGGKLIYYNDKEALAVCEKMIDSVTGKTREATFEEIVSNKNIFSNDYKLYTFAKLEGSYWDWIKGYSIFYVVLFLAIQVIKEAFFYVVSGKRMFRRISKYN